MTICQENGYHRWDKNFNSTFEDLESMEVTFECDECGAVLVASGDWEEKK